VKDKSVRFYANTFAGNVYVTEKGEIVYGLMKNVQGSALGVRSRDKNKIMKTPVKRPETQEPVARPISGQLGLDIVPASFINGQETKDTRPEIKNTIGAGSVPARSLNVGQGLSLAKESNPEGLPYKGIALRESLIGAKEMNIKGEDKAKTQVNYFVGDKKNWKSNIPAWDAVNFGEVYNGITFKLKAYGKNVEKLFTVNPGGKVEDIKLRLQGAKGMEVNKSGELEVGTGLGNIKFTKPYAYQEIDGKRVEVECKFEVQSAKSTAQSANSKLSKNEIASPLDILLTRNVITPSPMPHAPSTELSYGFTVASYNPNYPLIIDPLLASTFIGGSGSSGDDYGNSIAIGSGGNIFVTGSTSSPKFPTTSEAYDTLYNGSGDVFISKLNSNLDTLLSSTFLGGSSSDSGSSIAMDLSGNIYVTGGTSSSDFPTTSEAYDTSYNGGDDVFVSKLNNNLGTLLSSTFIGGSSDDSGSSIAMDLSGNIYVAGGTYSSNYPTTIGAYDTSHNTPSCCYYSDVFVSKLNNSLSSLLASTFIGGVVNDSSSSIAIDSAENIFVTGSTHSSNYPTTPGAYDVLFNDPDDGYYPDIFISKLNNSLSSLLASTFLGRTADYYAKSIAIDSSDNVFVAGVGGIPATSGAYDTSSNGESDVFVSKLNNSLTSLLASTFIGGSSNDFFYSMAIDTLGNIFITGTTYTSNYSTNYPYPTTTGAYDTSHNGIFDVFVSKLNNNLTSLLASTFLGGSGVDYGKSIAIDSGGNIFVTGYTYSSDFSTTPGAYDASFNGGSTDVFVSKLNNNLNSLLSSTFLGAAGGDGSDTGNSLTIDSKGNVFVTGSTGSPNYPTTSRAYDNSFHNDQDVFVSKLDDNLTSLLSSTFLGGSGDDIGASIAIDTSGNVFATGYTYSSDFPATPGAYDTSQNGDYDVFVSKLDNNLSSLLASTFLGKSDEDRGNSIAIDSGGDIFVTGDTSSSDFPTTSGAYDTSHNGGYDVFVSKLDNSLSSLLGSTFLGGSGEDRGNSIAIDSKGNIYLSGKTFSSGYYSFPTTPGAYDTSHNGGYKGDAFVSKLDNNLNSLLASTFLGGSDGDTGNSIAIDSKKNIFVTGDTWSTDFPTTPGAYDTSHNWDYDSDVFVSKLDNSLSSLLASTFLGGSENDYGNSITIDSKKNIFATGYTSSSDFPTTPGAYDTSFNGSYYSYKGVNDVFVSKLDNNLSSLLASTFLGGDNADYGKSIAIDSKGNIYLSGQTFSSGYYPTTPGAYDTSFNGNSDVFVSKLDNNLSADHAPDLRSKDIKLPKVVKQGRILHIRATGKNIGNADASSFNVGFYLSSNNNKSIDGDTLLGEETLSGLVKNKAKKVIYKWNVPKDFLKGNYYIKVFWDNENSIAESNEDNNIGVSSKIEVRENQSHPQGRVFPRFF